MHLLLSKTNNVIGWSIKGGGGGMFHLRDLKISCLMLITTALFKPQQLDILFKSHVWITFSSIPVTIVYLGSNM